jgi:putative DNA primase/helicase
VINRFASYAEVSPSGQGVKVFFKYDAAALPDLRRAMETEHSKTFSRGAHCEIALHLGNRYFAVTGQSIDPNAELVGPEPLRRVGKTDLLWLIREAGPAFIAGTEAGGNPNDSSRSGHAYRLALDLQREGRTFDDFKRACAEDSEGVGLARYAQERRNGRRLKIERDWERAGKEAEQERANVVTLFPELPPLPASADDLKAFARDEAGVIDAFESRFRDALKFDNDIGRWLQWTGVVWQVERTRLAFDWARRACLDLASRGPKNAAGKSLRKVATAAAVERGAQALRCFSVESSLWDTDPWLLGTPNGTVDLRTGHLRPARQADYITKLTASGPAAMPLLFDAAHDCPRWLAFLEDATGGDADLIRFLQQWCGYALTGDTREHALLFIYGPGGNGKSVFLNTMTGLLADYCRTAGMDVFSASKFDRHTTELARLRGARMVCASETEEGRAWAEVRINQLTGGDVVTARFMRQDDFEFRPEFKLTIIGNHKPLLNAVTDAARRRFNIVPFARKPKRVDPELESKLKEEWPGILSWAIAGCLDWQANGLVRPQVVIDATADYFEQQDTFLQWLEECCETGAAFAATTSELFGSWSYFASGRGEKAGSRNKTFPDKMRAHGFTAIKDTDGIRGRGFSGVCVRSEFGDLDGDDLL